MTAATKGKWTFRTAAVLLVISALTELVPPTAPVPLFGAMQGGPVALFYHLFYAGLYVGLGVGLWQAKLWGYTLLLFTTGVYTLDRLQLLLFREAVLARSTAQTRSSRRGSRSRRQPPAADGFHGRNADDSAVLVGFCRIRLPA